MVSEDDPVRAIWAFAEQLDLSSYYNKIKSRTDEAGRPAYNPKVLLSMWIWAWRWLCGDQPINYHTLSSFRVGHKDELDELFTNSLGVLSAEGLITLERITQDGTKIKANAGIDTFRKADKLKAHLKLAREQVELLSDPESEPVTRRRQKARERAATERCKNLEQAIEEYEKLRQNKRKPEKIRVSAVDPESRVMKQSNGGYNPSYNAQIALETSNKIIVGKHTTSNCEDTKELEPMIENIYKGKLWKISQTGYSRWRI